ncbi:MAG: L-threonine 3-dehydrogenase, partial [Chloroflexota bacterium]
SGSSAALRSAIEAMAHGGRIAQRGIPTGEVTLDRDAIVCKMLTLQGIYGREMFETWYKMTVMVQSGLDIRPAITHRFSFRDHERAFEVARSGDSGKVIMDWMA